VQEVFPVVAGAIVGVAVHRLTPSQWRIPLIVLLSLVIGFLAAALAGELAISAGFILIDVGQVLVMALLGMAASTLWACRARTVH
jgi:hypothetical protein